MKKKLLKVCLMAAVSAFVLAGCGSKADDTKAADENAAEETSEEETAAGEEAAGEESETAPADERTTFKVGFDAEYPPYGYMDESGEYTGFDLELAEAICELEGWELVKTPIEWASKDMELDSGTIDCIWNGFTINNREDDYTWSVPYVDNSQVMIIAEDSDINSLADLAGKTVGVQAASAALELLKNEDGQKELADTFAVLQEFPDYNSSFVELQAGSIDAVAMDIGVAQYQIKSRGDGYMILDEALNSEQYGVGFKLGNEELRDIINADLQKLLENGKFEELAEKYELTDMICLEAE